MGWFSNVLTGAKPSVTQFPEGVLVVDVRQEQEYIQGHVKGAHLVPLPQLADGIGIVCPDHDRPIVVYCAAGGRSCTAAGQLRALGYTHVMDGGGMNNLVRQQGLEVVQGMDQA